MKRVLFSCLSGADPVQGMRDGPMLHIVRNFRPDKIVWYISKKMKELDEKDHRYDKTMKDFCKRHPGYHPKIVRVEDSTEDVSEFDVFYKPFEDIIKEKILKEDPDAEILLNLSSGSPQMKITLAMLAMDVRYKTRAIQVKSPERGGGSNKEQRTDYDNYDVELQLEMNLDNEPDEKSRCSEPQLLLVRRQSERERIETMLRTYNYNALSILHANFPPSCRTLISHLAYRMEYNTKEAEKLAEKLKGRLGFALYPVKSEKNQAKVFIYRRISEYYLCLKLMQRSKQLTSFVIRLNPFIVSLQEVYLREKYNFCVGDIQERDGNRFYITRRKVTEYSVDLMAFLDRELNIMRDKSDPSIYIYNYIIRYFADGEMTEDQALFDKLECLNGTQRNRMAHNLDNVSEESIINALGYDSRALLMKLEQLIVKIFPNQCKPELFSIYDRCNDFIIERL